MGALYESKSLNLRGEHVVPSHQWLRIFRNFQRLLEGLNIVNLYHILRQRTLRILCRREVLQQMGQCSETPIRRSFGSIR